MSTDRRTKADLLSELRLAKAEADVRVGDTAEKYGKEIKVLTERLDKQTPISRATDMCVQALDSLLSGEKSSSGYGYQGVLTNTTHGRGVYYPSQDRPAGGVGHVLALLHARYNWPDREGEVRYLQGQVNELTAEVERLRSRIAATSAAIEGRPL